MAALVSLAGFITTYVLGVRTLVGQTAENAILSNAHFVYEQPILALVSTPSLLLSCGMLAVIGYAQGRTRETTAGVVTVGVLVTLISALTQAVAAKQTGRPAATRGAVIVFASLSAPTAALASVAFIMQVQGLASLSMSSPLIGGSIAIASEVLAAVAAHLWFLPRSSTSGNASARRHAVEPE